MNGKVIGIVLVGLGLLAGVAMYWLQVYAFYEEARLVADGGEVEMKITATSGEVADLPVADFTAIDADSSPIRFRACFTTEVPAGLSPAPYATALPLNAPRWFDCFDAAAIGGDLDTGAAVAVLGQENVLYGIDRVIALYPDGRAFAWHQINRCGEEVFDGQPAPEGCPTPPERDE
ncbi:DUF6446 family protein [Palleronia sp. KMU-117]|uniref:DUF6446 family protein n=1 Tax=Palleronia sp. KMU-117 TaxID=3434108 RepID=UPI003D72C279